MRCSPENSSDQHEDVPKQDESSAAKQVAVGAAEHECNCTTQAIDRCEPSTLGRWRPKFNCHIRLNGADIRDRPPRDAVRCCEHLQNGQELLKIAWEDYLPQQSPMSSRSPCHRRATEDGQSLLLLVLSSRDRVSCHQKYYRTSMARTLGHAQTRDDHQWSL
jgi:hypothetical protein